MTKSKIFVGLIFLIIFSTINVNSQEPILRTYDFDEINVLYASKFNATVNEGFENSNCWINTINDELKNPIIVTYGVVELKQTLSNGEVFSFTEEFLKITGNKESKRFLVNTISVNYYDEEQGIFKVPSKIASGFWSAKVIRDNQVVKDFTPPIYQAVISRLFDRNKNLTNFSLSFSTNESKAQLGKSDECLFTAQLETVIQKGDPTAVATQ